MVQNLKFRVREKRQLAEQVFFYVLSLEEPAEINFKAGQFLNIKINNTDWKPYSICSAPPIKKEIEIVVDVSPKGEGSVFFEKLKKGEEVLGSGPFGTFTISKSHNDCVFIATGSGIAPIRSMISDLLENKSKKKIMLFFGVRHNNDIYFFKEFEDWEKQYPNFKFYGTLSKPEEDWKGLRGRVTEYLEKIGDFQQKEYYLCGAPETVNALKIYIVSSGVKEENIHYEQY